MSGALEILICVFLLVGSFFSLVGAIGFARLPDFFMRLQAPTKATTLGVGGLLIASMLYFCGRGQPSVRELAITLFLLATAPVSANLLARAAMHLRLDSRAPAERDPPSP